MRNSKKKAIIIVIIAIILFLGCSGQKQPILYHKISEKEFCDIKGLAKYCPELPIQKISQDIKVIIEADGFEIKESILYISIDPLDGASICRYYFRTDKEISYCIVGDGHAIEKLKEGYRFYLNLKKGRIDID